MKRFILSYRALWPVFLFFSVTLSAQNVGINDDGSNPDANAMLDIKSSSKGVLFPRLTTAQRTALGAANPSEGMLVFDSDVEAYFYFTDGDWVQLAIENNSGVPVGTVLPFAGAVTDDGTVLEPVPGYLLCNGAVVSSGQYPALLAVLLNAWGNANDGDAGTVNLPDLRGMFLRGVSGIRNDGREDPNNSSRTAMQTGGNTGNNVGSYQDDTFQGHYHNLVLTGVATETSSGGITAGTGNAQSLGYNYASSAFSDGTNGTPRTSPETRSKNACVHYIIKY